MMLVAKDLAEAVRMSFLNKDRTVHYPGGAITFADKLPKDRKVKV